MDDRLIRQIAAGIAAKRDLIAAGTDAVIGAKTAGGPCVRSTADEAMPAGDRKIRYVWSTEKVDRMGDIVRQNWDLGGYTRNPVALWGHDHDTVIGRAFDFGVELAPTKRLVGTIEFAPEGTDKFIDSRYKLAAAGYLKATSVGFLPHTTDPVRDSDKRKELGLGDYGVVFERNELLEISVVGVPANPEAVEADVRGYVERGVITTDDAEAFVRGSQPLTERDWFARLERMAADAAPASEPETFDTGALFAPVLSEVAALRDEIRALAEHIKTTQPNGAATPDPVAPDAEGTGRGWDYQQILGDFTEQVRAAIND